MTHRTSIARLADDAPVAKPESWVERRPPTVHGRPFLSPAAVAAYIDDTPAMLRAHAAIENEARNTAIAVMEMDARIRALKRKA
jgi:hypothetical protein